MMTNTSLLPINPSQFDYWKAHHLLTRAGFGGTPSQVQKLASLGLNQAVDLLLNYQDLPASPLKMSQFDSGIIRPYSQQERAVVTKARRNSDEAALSRIRQQRNEQRAQDRGQMRRIQAWWLKRIIETNRPTEEKMTLFWHGHFASSFRAVEDSYHMLMQNNLFRQHAVGNFKELAHAIIRDPAMIAYLNNNQNRRQAPNENLARELMELFTLGEGNAYSENDIKEGARCLTGYTFDDDEFVFKAQNHDDEFKTVLGSRGQFDGHDFIELIFRRPEVSQYICLKLYKFFVQDVPQAPARNIQTLIQRMAKELRSSNYEIKPVLRTLFRSQHFYDQSNLAAQIKSPIQLTVQAVRSLLRTVPAGVLPDLAAACEMMGQGLFYPPTVQGWTGGRNWINTSTMFVRQNTLIYMLTGRRPDMYSWETSGLGKYDATHLVDHLRKSNGTLEPREAIRYLLRFTLGSEPQIERIETLEKFVASRGNQLTNDMIIGLLALIAAMPEYQLC